MLSAIWTGKRQINTERQKTNSINNACYFNRTLPFLLTLFIEHYSRRLRQISLWFGNFSRLSINRCKHVYSPHERHNDGNLMLSAKNETGKRHENVLRKEKKGYTFQQHMIDVIEFNFHGFFDCTKPQKRNEEEEDEEEKEYGSRTEWNATEWTKWTCGNLRITMYQAMAQWIPSKHRQCVHTYVFIE